MIRIMVQRLAEFLTSKNFSNNLLRWQALTFFADVGVGNI